MSNTIEILSADAIELLKKLIATPSFSKEEDKTAELIFTFLLQRNITGKRLMNNVYAFNKYFDRSRPSVLLNSHHDTVKPNKGYTLNPFEAIEKDNKLFGLGSNDAGGALVSLIAAFLYFYNKENLKYNIMLAATAEEEITGKNGIELLLKDESFLQIFKKDDCFAIVGEPTLMQMAVAERGLLVLDCTAYGVAGHAAREEGINAISIALKDIEWFSNYRFEKVSDLLGPVKMTTTVIVTENRQHNVVPAECKYVVDIRVNELYRFEEILSTIKKNVQSEIIPRSSRLKPSSISLEHPLVKAGLESGINYYGSPTTSDKALIPFPALKMGPGDSARSHTADEFIYIDEIKKGIETYIQLLKKIIYL